MDYHLPTSNEAEFEELLAKASERERAKRREEEAARNAQMCADLEALE